MDQRGADESLVRRQVLELALNQYEQAFGELRQMMAMASQERQERAAVEEAQGRLDRVYQLAETMPPEDALRYIRWFAQYQPFTPVIETVRGLLTGTRIGGSGLASVAWCAGIALVGYLWARRLYARPRA